MPNIAYGDNSSKAGTADFGRMNFDYDYPGGLDLKPGSKLHRSIVDKVIKRANDSAFNMANRFASWNNIDHTLTTYIDLTDKEKDLQDVDSRKPVSIVFPHSYAILETMLGYLIAAFFQDPVFRYEGVGPNATVGAILMEKIIDLQVNKAKMILNLHTQFRDALAYGFGVVALRWGKKHGFKVVRQEVKKIFRDPDVRKSIEKALLFEGNELINIDPYLCLPDPNTPITDIQKSEYFGYIEFTNYMDLLSLEQTDKNIFNSRYLTALVNKRTSVYVSDESGRNKRFKMTKDDSNTYTKPVDRINMYIKIIPKEWKIGKEEYPKIYYFSVAGDQVLVEMRPLGLTHNMIPVALAAPDYDGYSTCPISRLETLYGMQHTLDWMFNTHIANVRKAINDTIIYDPYLLNTKDLKDPKPGGLIRLRKPAWGRGVKDTHAQLAVTDVTRGHVADGAIIQQSMEKTAGVDSASMGTLRQGGPERLTKGEFQGTQSGTFTRLERIARIISVQSMQDIGYMAGHHTQQFMSQDNYLKATGRWQEVLMREYNLTPDNNMIKVSPFDILVDWELKIRDGSVPGSNYSGVWIKMFEVLANHQELLQNFDITKIFTHIARNEGAKNVEQFVRVKQMPADQVDQEAQAGNLIPIAEAMGGV